MECVNQISIVRSVLIRLMTISDASSVRKQGFFKEVNGCWDLRLKDRDIEPCRVPCLVLLANTEPDDDVNHLHVLSRFQAIPDLVGF